MACFEHPNFLTVNATFVRRRKLIPRRLILHQIWRDVRRTFNYELFNCNNFNIRYWSWNYRGCWHQTCPPILIPITKPKGPVLLFSVTTSPYQDWVIYAPAAFLGCGSRLSGSLSGIEP
eukprot:maker-scaffold_154-snap-gene-0.4-mRNA-1 protein AED:0.46 eAED:0.50 QI:0/0/0/1/0/0/3/0/118